MDTPSSAIGAGRAWYAVLLLGALYIVAFVDRAILGLLVEPIKADLRVTDNQMSLLIGLTFAVFYSLVGLPLGRLADRISRRRIIIVTALVWGGCTFSSGFATTARATRSRWAQSHVVASTAR